MVNGRELKVSPGATTVTCTESAVAIRFAGTEAVSCAALTNVVDTGVPFHCTAAPLTNPRQFTVKVNAGPPAVAVFGFREVTVGGLVIVNGAELEVVPA